MTFTPLCEAPYTCVLGRCCSGFYFSDFGGSSEKGFRVGGSSLSEGQAMSSHGSNLPGLGCRPPRCQSALCFPGLCSPLFLYPHTPRELSPTSRQSRLRAFRDHPHLLGSLLHLISLSHFYLGFIKLPLPPWLRWWTDSEGLP